MVLVKVEGLFAAVVTPVHADGRIDFDTFDRVVAFLAGAGVSGICIAGATGEYPHFETADRRALIERAAARLPGGCALLVGIGAPSMRLAVELGRAAIDAGCRALLLPMPMFFRYEQADLAAYAAAVSDTLRAPCLLYNLPAFTNGLEAKTIVGLLNDQEFVVGVKDSSGRMEDLAALQAARGVRPWSLLVGDDRALHAGLEAGWDGGISGVAGFCPELLVGIYRSHTSGQSAEAARLQRLLDELIEQLNPFPTPWGIRIGLAARGLATGPLPLPVTAARQRQLSAFMAWLPGWLARNDLTDAAAGVARS